MTDPDDKVHTLQTERRLAEQMYQAAERLRHVANDAIATVERLKGERDTLQAENKRLRTLAEAATRLVATLPRCSYCPRPATRAWVRGAARYCDGCTPEDCVEYPHAQPLRDTVAALDVLEKETS